MGCVGCPVLNLQEQLWALDIYFENETLAAEDSLFFTHSEPVRHLAMGAPKLQVLQAQLIKVHTRQEYLLRQMDNFTRNPGLAPSPPDWDSSEMGGKGRAACSWERGSLGPNPLPWQGRGFENPGLVWDSGGQDSE